jgi:hypothetical protein
MLKYREYLNKLNEKESFQNRDFSFSTWLVEAIGQNPEIRAKVAAMPNPQALEKAELIMELVKQKLFTHFPMWRPFWSKMPPIASFGAGDAGPDGIGTMCTTGTAIFYDPKFVIMTYELGKINFASEFKDGVVPNAGMAIRTGARHPMDYALFVIIHEILHCSLKHHLRMPNYESDLISFGELLYFWNIAADYEINHLLLDDVKSDLYRMVIGGVRADQEGGSFAVPAEELEFFVTSSAEKIFYRLVRNIEEKRLAEQGNKEEDINNEGGESGEEGDNTNDGGESGSEGGDGGNNSQSDNKDFQIKPGDVIYDNSTGEYGVVSNIAGEEIDYEPISEEEARKKLKK